MNQSEESVILLQTGLVSDIGDIREIEDEQ